MKRIYLEGEGVNLYTALRRDPVQMKALADTGEHDHHRSKGVTELIRWKEREGPWSSVAMNRCLREAKIEMPR